MQKDMLIIEDVMLLMLHDETGVPARSGTGPDGPTVLAVGTVHRRTPCSGPPTPRSTEAVERAKELENGSWGAAAVNTAVTSSLTTMGVL